MSFFEGLKRNKVPGLLLAVGVLAVSLIAAATGEKKAAKGFLGVSVSSLDNEQLDKSGIDFGVRVESVSEGEAADKGGIRENDIIQYFGAEKIRDPEALTEAVQKTVPGTKVTVKLIRDGKPRDVSVTIGALKSVQDYFVWKDGEKGNFTVIGRGGYIGVEVIALDNDDLASYFGVKPGEGALVLDVEAKSPAAEAGIKAGDVIVKVDGKMVNDPGDVRKAVSGHEKGEEVAIDLIRRKAAQTVKVKIAEKPGINMFFRDDAANLGIRVPRIDIPEGAFFWKDGDGAHVRIQRLKRDLAERGDRLRSRLDHLDTDGWREKLDDRLDLIRKKIERNIRVFMI